MPRLRGQRLTQRFNEAEISGHDNSPASAVTPDKRAQSSTDLYAWTHGCKGRFAFRDTEGRRLDSTDGEAGARINETGSRSSV